MDRDWKKHPDVRFPNVVSNGKDSLMFISDVYRHNEIPRRPALDEYYATVIKKGDALASKGINVRGSSRQSIFEVKREILEKWAKKTYGIEKIEWGKNTIWPKEVANVLSGRLLTKIWTNPYSLYGMPRKYDTMSTSKSQRSTLKCNFCGKVFTRVIGPKTYEISCPKCKETDVDIMNPGEAWHADQYKRAMARARQVEITDESEFDIRMGEAGAHNISVIESRRRDIPNPKLSVPEQHQLKIARKTLTYSDVGARIMGGPNKEEARLIIYKLTGKWPKENPIARAVRPKFKLSKLFLPAIVIGAIIWFARKS